MTNSEFEEIIKNYERLVFTICFQMTKDYQEAQNLTQDTFFSAYTHIESCPKNNIKPWLTRIAANKAKDFLKSAYNRHTVFDTQGDTEHTLLDTGQRPDDIFTVTENKIELHLLHKKIKELNEPYNKVSVMFFIEEKNVDEISKALNRPKKTIQTQIFRARQLLQNLLKGECNDERII